MCVCNRVLYIYRQCACTEGEIGRETVCVCIDKGREGEKEREVE